MLVQINLPDQTAKPLQERLEKLMTRIADAPDLLDFIEDQLSENLSWVYPEIEKGLLSPKLSFTEADQILAQQRNQWLNRNA